MSKVLTPSVNSPSDMQIEKLHERLLSATSKSGVTPQQFYAALAYPGVELEDGLLAVIVRFAKKASGIIVAPISAEDTGLVPNDWEVESDDLEGEINLAAMDYHFSVRGDTSYIVNGYTVLQEAGNAYGSLGFAAVLLKAQDEGKEIFPVASRNKHYFFMPRTILLDDRRGRYIAYFDWIGGRWALDFHLLDDHLFGRGRFVRPRGE